MSPSVSAVVLSSPTPSPWLSCRTITANLSDAYALALGERAAPIGYELSAGSLRSCADAIRSRSPERVIFADHLPHPVPLLKCLLAARDPLPPLVVHIFGDFTLYSGAWVEFGQLLRDHPVKLVCASTRQAALVSSVLADQAAPVGVCPFPVDTETYRFDGGAREKLRRELEIDEQTLVLLYSGRISAQKNVLRLLRETTRFARAHPQKSLRLLISGGFDDMGAPFWGGVSTLGTHFQDWLRELAELDVQSCSNLKVQYLGFNDPMTLAGWYSAADLAVSLSLHHDEDFGMSPAEAACTGLPLLLTDWGGYSDFALSASSCDLVPVRIEREGLRIDSEAIQRSLLKHSASRLSDELRIREGRAAAKKLSIDSIAARLGDLAQTEPRAFPGFGYKLSELARRLSPPLTLERPASATFYEEIYRAYASHRQ